jgi:hypothetical protein
MTEMNLMILFLLRELMPRGIEGRSKVLRRRRKKKRGKKKN